MHCSENKILIFNISFQVHNLNLEKIKNNTLYYIIQIKFALFNKRNIVLNYRFEMNNLDPQKILYCL